MYSYHLYHLFVYFTVIIAFVQEQLFYCKLDVNCKCRRPKSKKIIFLTAWILRFKELIMLSDDRSGVLTSKDWSVEQLEKYLLPELTCSDNKVIQLPDGVSHFTAWKLSPVDL